MKPNYLIRVVSLLVLASAALTAQVARQGNIVPLKNWATPLYWQPNQVERQSIGNAVPQLQFSSNEISTGALTFVAITPCRLVDTRGAAAGFIGVTPFDGPGAPAGGGTLTFPVQSSSQTSTTAPAPCGAIPSTAQAYSVNLTVVPTAAGAVDNVTLWPAGSTLPVVATLNDPQGIIAQNAAIVPAGVPYGGISFRSTGPAAVDVIIDMNGYYAAPTDLYYNTALGTGALGSNTTGAYNTATGSSALQSNTTGAANTAFGNAAMANNTTGSGNSAVGSGALIGNTTGSNNTATGTSALQDNTTGGNNTAVGSTALLNNTTGSNNTAAGQNALNANTTGNSNTATGVNALSANTTGIQNTASGNNALVVNTIGNYNTASGSTAMRANTSGSFNTADGDAAMNANTTGCCNTAVGQNALYNNTTGSGNIAIGDDAAQNVSGANGNNIHIGSQGSSGDSSVIRIGGTQTSTYIAGIWGNTPNTTNLLVCGDANGDLGTTGCTSTPSSRRFKEHISDMGDSSSKLFQLRPVTFFYKPEYDDGSHTLQYGLIAEEVAKLYPEMVGYDKDGHPNSVKYQSLAPMLLNEVQKQNAQLQLQQEENRKLEDRLAALEALLSGQASTVVRPAGSQ